MDHEFSTSLLEEGQLGWDWFSIQLDNHTEIMLYQMRRSDGSIDPNSSGTFVADNGDVTPLTVSDFRMQPTDTWRSERTAGEYPLRWRIAIPRLGMVLQVEPAFEEQEMVTEATTGISYWEGSISVRGNQDQAKIQGKGYLELTGYAGRGLGSLLEDGDAAPR
jgi:predicted secreted hydrolase